MAALNGMVGPPVVRRIAAAGAVAVHAELSRLEALAVQLQAARLLAVALGWPLRPVPDIHQTSQPHHNMAERAAATTLAASCMSHERNCRSQDAERMCPLPWRRSKSVASCGTRVSPLRDRVAALCGRGSGRHNPLQSIACEQELRSGDAAPPSSCSWDVTGMQHIDGAVHGAESSSF